MEIWELFWTWIFALGSWLIISGTFMPLKFTYNGWQITKITTRNWKENIILVIISFPKIWLLENVSNISKKDFTIWVKIIANCKALLICQIFHSTFEFIFQILTTFHKLIFYSLDDFRVQRHLYLKNRIQASGF